MQDIDDCMALVGWRVSGAGVMAMDEQCPLLALIARSTAGSRKAELYSCVESLLVEAGVEVGLGGFLLGGDPSNDRPAPQS
jgi:hypothetical protein